MDVFVARQPIFDKNKEVVSYELLFRSNSENVYNCNDVNRATYEVITNSFLTIRIENITNGKKAFINFTENNIKSGLPYILPNKDIVIEILETVEPDEEIVEACSELKQKGYTLALDDFIFDTRYEKLMKFIDIIKVDFTLTQGIERRDIVRRFRSSNIKFLAEKVETEQEYEEAIKYGYSYFQGYFFSKPVIISGQSIPACKVMYLSIMRELKDGKMNINKLQEIMKKEVSISYQFLRLINSSKYSFKSHINSVNQALVLLGETEVVKWLYVITLSGIGKGESDELVRVSLIRARFAENITIKINIKEKAFDSFLLGMFSTIDALLNQSMEVALDAIFIKDEIKLALLGTDNFFKKLLKLIYAYEKADWKEVYKMSSYLKISNENLTESYINSLSYVNDIQKY